MFKKIALYSLLFLISLLIFLLATLPANVLWQKVLSNNVPLKKLGIMVKAVDGSVWDGRVHLGYRGAEGILDWDVDTLGLMKLELPVLLNLNSTVGQVSGNLVLSPDSSNLTIPKAEIDLDRLNPFFRRERVSLSGSALINQLVLHLDGNRLSYAEGRGSWTGGDIAYPVGRDLHERNLPPFFARVETGDNGEIRLGIKDTDADFDVIDATLDMQGEAFLQVRRRLLDLADEPARHANETDVIFKVKKPLY